MQRRQRFAAASETEVATPTAGHRAPPADAGTVATLAATVAKLQRQVADMRRYVKAWVLQEQKRRVQAAVQLQATVRGWLVRRRAQLALRERSASSRVGGPRSAAGRSADPRAAQLRAWARRYPTPRWLAKQHALRHARVSPQHSSAPRLLGVPDDRVKPALRAVCRLQALHVGRACRRALRRYRALAEAAVAVQAAWRGFCTRRMLASGSRRRGRPLRSRARARAQAQAAPVQALAAAEDVVELARALQARVESVEVRQRAQDDALRVLWQEVCALRAGVRPVVAPHLPVASAALHMSDAAHVAPASLPFMQGWGWPQPPPMVAPSFPPSTVPPSE